MKSSLCRSPLVAALLAVLAAAPSWAGAALPDTVFASHWYAISIQGHRSGWSEQTLRRTPEGIESSERTVLRVQMEGRTLTSARAETRRYDANLRLLEVEHEADQVGRKVHVTARRDGDRLLFTRQSPDGETRQELPLDNTFGGDLQILKAVLQGELKPGWTHVFTTVDCDLGRLDEITVTALQRLDDPRPGWLLQSQSKLLGIPSQAWVGDDGVILRQEVPGMMAMAMELVSQEQALAELEPFLLATAIPVGSNMGDPRKLRQVRLQVSKDGGDGDGIFPDTLRQSVLTQDGRTLLTVRAGEVPAINVKLPVTSEALQPYLQPSDLAPSADSRIIAQAGEIIAGETDAWQAARRLMWWVHRGLGKIDSEPRPMSALEVLEAKRGDCTEHAVLLAALCQAVGLPARMVGGLAYDAGAYHYHAWNEIYVGEWVEMDATWGQEVVDAGHIQTAAAALDSASVARLSLASSRTMGDLKLTILDYQKAP